MVKKGDSVMVGWKQAEVFWVGPCKYKEGHVRVGARSKDGNVLWVDASKVCVPYRECLARGLVSCSVDADGVLSDTRPVAARNKVRKSAEEVIAENGMEGTYAATAMRMAEICPAPDGNPDFWDNWKDEMKEREYGD